LFGRLQCTRPIGWCDWSQLNLSHTPQPREHQHDKPLLVQAQMTPPPPARWIRMSPASVPATSPPHASSPLSPSRSLAPRKFRGLGDMLRIACHRILHEFHAENVPPLLRFGICIVVVFQTAQFLKSICLCLPRPGRSCHYLPVFSLSAPPISPASPRFNIMSCTCVLKWPSRETIL
jgi:hypothetical protein